MDIQDRCSMERSATRLWRLEVVSGEPDYTWLMIDATFVKCHQHSAGARKGSTVRYTEWYADQNYYYKWYHKGINAKYLLADKGYDSDEVSLQGTL
jgi:hypothetical protein